MGIITSVKLRVPHCFPLPVLPIPMPSSIAPTAEIHSSMPIAPIGISSVPADCTRAFSSRPRMRFGFVIIVYNFIRFQIDGAIYFYYCVCLTQ